MAQGDLTLGGGNNPIAISATSSPGDTIYTAVSGTAQYDLVTIVASNTDNTVSVTVCIEWGGTAASDHLYFQIRPLSTVTLIPGMRVNNGKVIKAFASVASAVNCYVDYDRYTN